MAQCTAAVLSRTGMRSR